MVKNIEEDLNSSLRDVRIAAIGCMNRMKSLLLEEDMDSFCEAYGRYKVYEEEYSLLSGGRFPSGMRDYRVEVFRSSFRCV